MGSSNGITYESMLTYLRLAEKEINCALDVSSATNPFDCHHNYRTITDLQIYCDTLSDHMCHELTRLAPTTPPTPPLSPPSSAPEDRLDGHSKSQSLASMGSSGGSAECSESPPLVTNSVTNSSDQTNTNTMSSTYSERKSVHYINNNILENSCHRLSQYENTDELQTELLTANHFSLLVSLKSIITQLMHIFIFYLFKENVFISQ